MNRWMRSESWVESAFCTSVISVSPCLASSVQPNIPLAVLSGQQRLWLTRPAAALYLSLSFTQKQRWTHCINITLLYLLFPEAACTRELKGGCVDRGWAFRGDTAKAKCYKRESKKPHSPNELCIIILPIIHSLSNPRSMWTRRWLWWFLLQLPFASSQ